MTYQEVLAHLDALQMHKIKLGLDAMQSFLAKVDRPEQSLRVVHVAGTNGKGSVCTAISEVLGLAGYRVGVYTSPHLSSVRERFRIGADYISKEKFGELGNRICEVLGEEQITYFEFTTALGLLWFAQSEVDLVLLETGMGGRLDATNVVTPLVSVITSISMDHELYLGDSLQEIAGEKAGIIKPGIPVVTGARHPEATQVVARTAREVGAPLYSLGQDFDYVVDADNSWTWSGTSDFEEQSITDLHCSRSSIAQQENDSLSIAVLLLLREKGFKVTEAQINKGLARVTWPGRMEFFERDYVPEGVGKTANSSKKLSYLLDGAHNSEGVNNLAETLKKRFSYGKLIAIWGAMVDKDLTTTLSLILPLVDTLVITRPEGERSATPDQIYAVLDPQQHVKARCVAKVDEALKIAQEIAGEGDLILVGGSLYLIGAIRSLLLGELA